MRTSTDAVDALVNVPKIIESVAMLHLMTPAQLLERRRHHPLIDARRDVILALYRRGVTVSQIGRVLGFHHSTVIHHLDRRQR